MNQPPETGPGAIRFAETARSIGRAARLRGLEVPTFRSPPGLVGVQRTIRRRGASATVSVVVRGDPGLRLWPTWSKGWWRPIDLIAAGPTPCGPPCGWLSTSQPSPPDSPPSVLSLHNRHYRGSDARVAELVDAAGLNPAAPSGAYRFDSCPGHGS